MSVFNHDYNNLKVVDSNVGSVAQDYTDNKLGEIRTRKRYFKDVDIERDERPQGKRKKLSRHVNDTSSIKKLSDLFVRHNYKYTDIMFHLNYSDYRLLNRETKLALAYQYGEEYKDINTDRGVFNTF
jgi:hypothetical protein